MIIILICTNYNSQYVACLGQIITDYDLILATKALAEEGGYTYYNEKNNVYSMIDHCFMSRKLYGKCEQVAILLIKLVTFLITCL